MDTPTVDARGQQCRIVAASDTSVKLVDHDGRTVGVVAWDTGAPRLFCGGQWDQSTGGETLALRVRRIWRSR